MQSSRFSLGTAVLLLGVLACNLSASELTDLAATATSQALTLQAATSLPGSPTATLFTGVEVSVTSDTNCRTGPSQKFDLIFTAKPGSSFKVVGKNTPTGYWIINNPTGGTCWLWGQYAVIKGDPSSLPEYPAPSEPTAGPTKTPKPTKTPEATPTMSVPNAPGNLVWERTCEGGFASDGFTPIWIENVTLTWEDSINETGYHVFKNLSPLPDIPQDSTQYHMELRYNQGTGGTLYINFGVEAFNEAGSSPMSAVDVFKCP